MALAGSRYNAALEDLLAGPGQAGQWCGGYGGLFQGGQGAVPAVLNLSAVTVSSWATRYTTVVPVFSAWRLCPLTAVTRLAPLFRCCRNGGIFYPDSEKIRFPEKMACGPCRSVRPALRRPDRRAGWKFPDGLVTLEKSLFQPQGFAPCDNRWLVRPDPDNRWTDREPVVLSWEYLDIFLFPRHSR